MKPRNLKNFTDYWLNFQEPIILVHLCYTEGLYVIVIIVLHDAYLVLNNTEATEAIFTS